MKHETSNFWLYFFITSMITAFLYTSPRAPVCQAALGVTGGTIPGFWRNHALLVVQIRHNLMSAVPQRRGTAIPVHVILTCCTDITVPSKMDIRCDFGSFNMQVLVPPETEMKKGRLFIVCPYFSRKGNWKIELDEMIGFMPHQMAMFRIRGLRSQLLNMVEKMAFHERMLYWLAWARRNRTSAMPSKSLDSQRTALHPFHAGDIETGVSYRFWAHYAVVVLRIGCPLQGNRYWPAFSPPLAKAFKADVVLTCATDRPIPGRIELYSFGSENPREKTPLPYHRRDMKPGHLVLACIYCPTRSSRRKPPSKWFISPDTYFQFMPEQMALVPLPSLQSPILEKIEARIAAVRRQYWRNTLRLQTAGK
jgi:hypothetical protein